MAKPAKRPVAVFHISKLGRLGDFMQKVTAITQNVDANDTIFVNPLPTPSDIQSKLTDLKKAEDKVATRAAGAAAARDVAYNVVVDQMWALLAYVQRLADSAADEQEAEAIILASGFSLKGNTPRIKAPIAAKNLPVSGSVELTAKSAGKRASYNWQYSNADSKWMDLTPTLKSKMVLTDLEPATRVQFRVRTITRTGAGAWTQPVSLIVT